MGSPLVLTWVVKCWGDRESTRGGEMARAVLGNAAV